MLENAPQLTQNDLYRLILSKEYKENSDMNILIDKINEGYEYWDTVKYKKCPKGYSSEELWKRVKASRILMMEYTWGKYDISFGFTNMMQRLCHEFDMNFGQAWMHQPDISENSKRQYIKSSLMEEAIYSSMMEGAATTREVAKEMLRKDKKPIGKSQQMIANNYKTIQFISEQKNTLLSIELILQVHKLMTEKTLKNEEDAGRFRTNNDNNVVYDVMADETVHTPPDAGMIAKHGKGVQWGNHDMWAISAKLGVNMDKLEDFLVDAAAIPSMDADAVVVTNVRHYEALRKALTNILDVRRGLNDGIPGDLVSLDLRACIRHLAEIVGSVSSEDVLINVFKNFCIGK